MQCTPGIPKDELLKELAECKAAGIDPLSGKIFAYVYTTHNECFQVVENALQLFEEEAGPGTIPADSHEKAASTVVDLFHSAFLHENTLNPLVFPSLRRFETETVAMVADMLHGDGHCVGSVTSGGTESILTAIKTYRDRAKKLFPSIKNPEIVGTYTLSVLVKFNFLDLVPREFFTNCQILTVSSFIHLAGRPTYHPPCLPQGS